MLRRDDRGVLGGGWGNEAIWGFSGLIPGRCVDGYGVGIGIEHFFGLEALEFLESGAVVLVRGVDAALEAGEAIDAAPVGLRENDVLVGFVGAERFLLPELGLDRAEAAKVPFRVDEGVDEHSLFGGGGVEAMVVVGRESFEVGDFFAADDLGFGVDAGFECVHGEEDSLRAGGFLGGGVVSG